MCVCVGGGGGGRLANVGSCVERWGGIILDVCVWGGGGGGGMVVGG